MQLTTDAMENTSSADDADALIEYNDAAEYIKTAENPNIAEKADASENAYVSQNADAAISTLMQRKNHQTN